jgi:hypothetical protein
LVVSSAYDIETDDETNDGTPSSHHERDRDQDDGHNEGLAKGDGGLPRSDEAYLGRKEPTPVEMANVAVHPGVANEETEVETVGALENRYGGRHLVVGRRRQLKKWTQDGGSRKKLAAFSSRMTCTA